MTPAEDKIRVDLSNSELLHLTSLAHLGFKKMMPNDRDIEMHRFGDELHALEVTTPSNGWNRPFRKTSGRSTSRQSRALIRNWWPPERKSA